MIIIALGSNLPSERHGEPCANCEAALDALRLIFMAKDEAGLLAGCQALFAAVAPMEDRLQQGERFFGGERFGHADAAWVERVPAQFGTLTEVRAVDSALLVPTRWQQLVPLLEEVVSWSLAFEGEETIFEDDWATEIARDLM